MSNPQIGPFDKISLSLNASFMPAPDGSVILQTGNDTASGALFQFGFDGKLKVNGVELGGSGGSGVSQSYVDSADEALSDRIQALEDAPAGGSPVTAPAWTTATLLNGVRNHPESPSVKNELAAFRKVGHRVELTGLLQMDSTMRAGEGFVLFTLPAACRPAQYQKLLPVALTQGCGTLKVLPNGNVILLSGQTDSYLSLHGVSFTLD